MIVFYEFLRKHRRSTGGAGMRDDRPRGQPVVLQKNGQGIFRVSSRDGKGRNPQVARNISGAVSHGLIHFIGLKWIVWNTAAQPGVLPYFKGHADVDPLWPRAAKLKSGDGFDFASIPNSQNYFLSPAPLEPQSAQRKTDGSKCNGKKDSAIHLFFSSLRTRGLCERHMFSFLFFP